MSMKCFYCRNIVTKDEKKFFCPIETPYRNILFHRKCYDKIDDYKEYFNSNMKRVLKYKTSSGRKNRKRYGYKYKKAVK